MERYFNLQQVARLSSGYDSLPADIKSRTEQFIDPDHQPDYYQGILHAMMLVQTGMKQNGITEPSLEEFIALITVRAAKLLQENDWKEVKPMAEK